MAFGTVGGGGGVEAHYSDHLPNPVTRPRVSSKFDPRYLWRGMLPHSQKQYDPSDSARKPPKFLGSITPKSVLPPGQLPDSASVSSVPVDPAHHLTAPRDEAFYGRKLAHRPAASLICCLTGSRNNSSCGCRDLALSPLLCVRREHVAHALTGFREGTRVESTVIY